MYNSSIHDLPNEIIVHIFSFLSSDDLVTKVARVCCRWWEIAGSSTVWNGRQFIYAGHSTLHRVINLLNLVKCLKKIRIEIHPSGIIFPWRTVPNLCFIGGLLSIAFSGKECSILLQDIIKNHLKIDELCVGNVALADKELALLISKLPGLTIIQIEWAANVCSSVRLKELADEASMLTQIDFSTQFLELDQLTYFLEKKGPVLTHLSINLSAAGGKSTVPLLKFCKNGLRKLELRVGNRGTLLTHNDVLVLGNLKNVDDMKFTNGVNVQPFVFHTLFQQPAFQQLRCLTVEQSEVLSDDMVAGILKSCKLLEELHLIGASSMKGLGLEGIRSCQHLTVLDLSYCCQLQTMTSVSDCFNLQHLCLRGCRSLTLSTFEAILKIKTLLSLDLSFCDISVLPLTSVSIHLPNLTCIKLIACNGIDRDRLAQFSKTAPHVNIVRD